MRHLGPVGKRFSFCATFMKETEDSARKWLWVLGGDGPTLFFFSFQHYKTDIPLFFDFHYSG